MKVGIVGLPLAGKSALFTAITGIKVDPHAARAPHPAVVRVPEPRLAYLTELYNPKKVIEATIEFMDIPGCSWDDANGRDEWRRLLSTVRQMECLVVVARGFENAAVPAYKTRVDPAADFGIVWDEFLFSDLEAVTTRLDRLESALKKPSKTHDAEKREQALLIRCRDALEKNEPISSAMHTDEERRSLASFGFLTELPIVAVRNISEGAPSPSADDAALCHAKAALSLNAEVEAEIAMLDPADRPAFLAEMGIESPARDRLIRTCYSACGLISFLTMGSDEVRAWTVRAGSSAVEAAGKIHTDLARGFVRAETVAYDDLVAAKDLKGAKAAGKVRKEGKTYIVADGDILNILANA